MDEPATRADEDARRAAANERWRRQVGPALSPADVARLLGTSVQAVEQDPGLLMLHQPGTGTPVYPVFQFDGHRTLAGLAEVIRILSPVLRPEGIAGWCTAVRGELDGRTPAQVLLDRGEAQRVTALAQQLASRPAS